jgi:hypothetical protein
MKRELAGLFGRAGRHATPPPVQGGRPAR